MENNCSPEFSPELAPNEELRRTFLGVRSGGSQKRDRFWNEHDEEVAGMYLYVGFVDGLKWAFF